MPSTISRLPGDVLFFIINYYAQRDFVFKTKPKAPAPPKEEAENKNSEDKPRGLKEGARPKR